MPPRPSVRYVLNPSLRTTVLLEARTRGAPPTKVEFVISEESRAYAEVLYALTLVSGDSTRWPRSVTRHLDFLVESGIAVHADAAPVEVDARWGFTEATLNLVPKGMRAQAQPRLDDPSVRFNEGCVFLQEHERRPVAAPPGITPRGTFPLGRGLVWVFDPAHRMWAVYQPGPELLAPIRALAAGRLAPHQLTAPVRELLWHARILAVPQDRRARERQWKQVGPKEHRTLAKERCIVVRGLIAPLQVAVLREYLRAREAEGYFRMDEEHVRHRRFFGHNDPLLQFVHRQSGQFVRQLLGEAVLPSFCLVSAYLPRARLSRHRDRPQCKWNASLLIDEQPEVEVADSWPLFIETPVGVRELRLGFGDAVFYPGSELPHWRRSIGPGRRQTVGTLHYVPIDFTGKLE